MDAELQPGTIVHLHCTFTEPAKDKLLVLLCKHPKPLFFFINSQIHPFIRNRKALLDCQVIIDAANHPCLNYDSYIDCTEACTIADYEIQLERHPEWIRDRISKEVKQNIVIAAGSSPLLPDLQLEWIQSGLNDL